MNNTRIDIIDNLGQIVGAENVLADVEDLYVYSYERIFRKQQYSTLDFILRVSSKEQVQEICRLAKKKDFTVIRRSVGETEGVRSGRYPTVLVDDTVPPELERSRPIKEYAKEVSRAGHGTFRNLALAFKTLFMKRAVSKCLQRATCSGYCTVTPAFNDVETWSSKGRALLMRGLSKGELQPSGKLIDVLYTCSLCGLCFAECSADTQVRKAIMDTRRHLAEKGLAPDVFTATAKNVLATGDVAKTPPAKRVGWMRNLSAKPLEKADVLYWVGCVVASRTPNTAKAVASVLSTADVDFALLGEKEGCCGYVLLASGLWKEARDVALRVVERMKETESKILVTSCAGCYYTFSKLYPEVLNVELPCNVMHASQFVHELVSRKQLELRGLKLAVTYHDPCSLGRHSGVFEEPREILKAIPGLRLIEMPLSRRHARCCGAGGGLWSFNYQVSVDSASLRLAEDVVPLGVDTLATACPTCHLNFRHASVKKSLGIKTYDVMEVVEKSACT